MEQEKPHDKKAKEYNIVIDNKSFKWPQPTITGAQIKELVKADPSYGVWLVVKGPAEDEEIADTQAVDLTQPGKEKFITGPKKSTEGEASFLPLRCREYLAEKGLSFEEATDGAQRGVIFRDYPLPTAIFDTPKADLLILIPPGYADTPPDMFYLLPWVKLVSNKAYPRCADQPHMFAGKSWQRWSRHSTEWRPGIDGIWSMLKRVDHALKVAA